MPARDKTGMQAFHYLRVVVEAKIFSAKEFRQRTRPYARPATTSHLMALDAPLHVPPVPAQFRELGTVRVMTATAIKLPARPHGIINPYFLIAQRMGNAGKLVKIVNALGDIGMTVETQFDRFLGQQPHLIGCVGKVTQQALPRPRRRMRAVALELVLFMAGQTHLRPRRSDLPGFFAIWAMGNDLWIDGGVTAPAVLVRYHHLGHVVMAIAAEIVRCLRQGVCRRQINQSRNQCPCPAR